MPDSSRRVRSLKDVGRGGGEEGVGSGQTDVSYDDTLFGDEACTLSDERGDDRSRPDTMRAVECRQAKT